MKVISRRKALWASAILVLAAPLAAQVVPQTPGAPDATRVSGGTYKIDPDHTLIGWRVDHLGFTPYFGIFGGSTGSLVLDKANLSNSKVDVTIPVGKVTTASEGLTGHLLRAPKVGAKPDFFGANPADARFVSTSVVADADAGTAQITGNLTLNGVTKPVTLAAKFYGAGKAPAEMGGQENVGFEATAKIKRSDFGIVMGIPMVSDEVLLDIAAAFAK